VSGQELRRVLVLVPGALGERLTGPEIRAWEFAKALSIDYEVTVAAHCDATERDGISVVPSSRRHLLREATRHDAVLSACLPPYLLALKQLHGFLAISDQYDPLDMEMATLAAGRLRDREVRSRAAMRALQLCNADVVLCAAERQRANLISTARSLDHGRSRTGRSRTLDPVVLPFGIPDPPPASERRPLHEHFPQLADTDTLVLWWGNVWRWLDAETPVRAFARMAASRSDIKLVITAGKPPNKSVERAFDATEEIRALADELDVLGRTVLFFDEWIPYEERYDHLREADIGLTLHRHADEARLAARARYMDYLSAELPCVLGRGDETAEEFGAAGFATLLDDPDPDELLAALIALADAPGALGLARAAGNGLAAGRHWSVVGERLRTALRTARPSPMGPRASLELVGSAGGYYASRLAARAEGALAARQSRWSAAPGC
jgi:glycosyltransferase involved in cell wall biosynthesis